MPRTRVSIAYKRFRGTLRRATVSPMTRRYIPSAGDGWSMSEPEQTGNRQEIEPSDLDKHSPAWPEE